MLSFMSFTTSKSYHPPNHITLQLTAIAAVFFTTVFCTKGAVLLCFLLQLVLSPSHACEVTPKPLRFHIEGVTWIEVG